MKQYVNINLDKTRNLRYGHRALIKIEEMLNRKLAELENAQLGIKELDIIIYCGLIHEDKTLTFEQFLDIVEECDITFEELSTKIKEAFEVTFGKKEKKQ